MFKDIKTKSDDNQEECKYNNLDPIVCGAKNRFDEFIFSTKICKSLLGHENWVNSIDYMIFCEKELVCSGSSDKTVRLWDVETAKQIGIFKEHSDYVYCVKFSKFDHYHFNSNVICSSSSDKIYFYDVKYDEIKLTLDYHNGNVFSFDFSPFQGGRYLCSESDDNTICMYDLDFKKLLYK
ncbi:hypothetical protein RFI_39521 [Reticulomyxa filosa]|uniref:TEP-1 C-terminal beta-propeller domain-containing protein n=1 Tax=Reticulomyxa filosa TaxID=46433 RepID=X6LA40_RETFI|nr:hypothetical protein RFI_39521 [Reticulomyxa filosa]|eukprot:ETN98001.1 hypothetical protein RFI_39521 [Reticulomyxa filosa]